MTPIAQTDRSPEELIEIITTSLHCFRLGCLALIPIIGIAFAIVAIRASVRFNRRIRNGINPAKAYSTWAPRLACIGIISTTLLVTAGYAVLSEMFSGHRGFYGCPFASDWE